MGGSFDIIIIGGGPAGVSAALTCRSRGKTAAVVSNGETSSSLYKAERITNYPGFEEISGEELSSRFTRQLKSSGAEILRGRALSVMPMDSGFGVAVGNDYFSCAALIVAAGITRERLYPGEGELLGRGVSYCATCDGMLYRGKTVALIGEGEEARNDGEFLRSIGCTVLEYPENGKYEIVGEERARAVRFKGEEREVDGVFIIKDTVSVTRLVPGLEYRDGGIVTDRNMAAAVPGVFAAGDCTGKPYQIAKAVGEGNIAALSACRYVDSLV